MATGVEELVDMLFAMIDEAKSVPLSSEKCIIERDKALDLLDDIKAQFPMELGEAKKLLAARADYIASAKREAELIRKQAEDQAKQMLAQDELMAQAKQKGNEMIRTAEERSREQGITYLRLNTGLQNSRMQHILEKNGFTRRGIIVFKGSQKYAYDKRI